MDNADYKLKLKGHWDVLKGKIKQTYGQLTDDDLMYVEGKEDELIGRIEKKTGSTKSTIIEFIQKL